MSDNKIIKQIVEKFKNSKLTILNENIENQSMEIHVYFQGFKERKGTMTTTDIEKILSKFQNEIITNVMTIITQMEKRITNNTIKMMNEMEQRINDRIDKVELKIDNLKDEMNDRFDKLESRVSTLESFHKKDLSKK